MKTPRRTVFTENFSPTKRTKNLFLSFSIQYVFLSLRRARCRLLSCKHQASPVIAGLFLSFVLDLRILRIKYAHRLFRGRDSSASSVSGSPVIRPVNCRRPSLFILLQPPRIHPDHVERMVLKECLRETGRVRVLKYNRMYIHGCLRLEGLISLIVRSQRMESMSVGEVCRGSGQ